MFNLVPGNKAEQVCLGGPINLLVFCFTTLRKRGPFLGIRKHLGYCSSLREPWYALKQELWLNCTDKSWIKEHCSLWSWSVVVWGASWDQHLKWKTVFHSNEEIISDLSTHNISRINGEGLLRRVPFSTSLANLFTFIQLNIFFAWQNWQVLLWACYCFSMCVFRSLKRQRTRRKINAL